MLKPLSGVKSPCRAGWAAAAKATDRRLPAVNFARRSKSCHSPSPASSGSHNSLLSLPGYSQAKTTAPVPPLSPASQPAGYLGTLLVVVHPGPAVGQVVSWAQNSSHALSHTCQVGRCRLHKSSRQDGKHFRPVYALLGKQTGRTFNVAQVISLDTSQWTEGFVAPDGSLHYHHALAQGKLIIPFKKVIRKVNKQHAILDVDEPVSQLHKCAFQFRDSPHTYLCLSNDTIIQYQAPSSVKDPSRVVLNDGSCWTIIGVNGGGHVAMLEVQGENFSPHLKVWFGNSEAETMFKSPKSLLCVVPDVSVFSDGWRCLRRIITVPLSLIRLDGLIYRTTFSFTYSPELQPPPSVRGAAGGGGKRDGGVDGGQEDDVLLETIHQEFTRANFHLFMQS
ncbi:recombining binding protein suppressor of hairless-like protein isoform X1 [Lates japonicus]|uniref:Recombining binding protein suppressor of hairless-like protein isoform X1 n=1 Tax=Lates japonicus TaxID=270547 RepID=A0AAD3RKR4_LATJO|nr:recombining binding protein suppressor of hairless-like protein isoform X1 [Lates japonicus]